MMKLWKVYGTVFLILFFLIIIQLGNREITGPLRGIAGDFLNPPLYYSNKVITFFDHLYQSYVHLVDLKGKNISLVKENKRISFDNVLLREKLRNYDRLKKLLEFKEAYELDTIACNVIGRNIEGYLKYLVIDRGRSDGIYVNDAVISFDGLVGKVFEVYKGTSKVVAILDISNSVSVMNFNTRSVGILHGDGMGGLDIDFYSKNEYVKLDDIFITSGLGGVYPKGIPVGTVDEIISEGINRFLFIKIKQNVDFYKLENVLVVKNSLQ